MNFGSETPTQLTFTYFIYIHMESIVRLHSDTQLFSILLVIKKNRLEDSSAAAEWILTHLLWCVRYFFLVFPSFLQHLGCVQVSVVTQLEPSSLRIWSISVKVSLNIPQCLPGLPSFLPFTVSKMLSLHRRCLRKKNGSFVVMNQDSKTDFRCVCSKQTKRLKEQLFCKVLNYLLFRFFLFCFWWNMLDNI